MNLGSLDRHSLQIRPHNTSRVLSGSGLSSPATPLCRGVRRLATCARLSARSYGTSHEPVSNSKKCRYTRSQLSTYGMQSRRRAVRIVTWVAKPDQKALTDEGAVDSDQDSEEDDLPVWISTPFVPVKGGGWWVSSETDFIAEPEPYEAPEEEAWDENDKVLSSDIILRDHCAHIRFPPILSRGLQSALNRITRRVETYSIVSYRVRMLSESCASTNQVGLKPPMCFEKKQERLKEDREEFARTQAEVGKFKVYDNSNDNRLISEKYPVRDYTDEEIMEFIGEYDFTVSRSKDVLKLYTMLRRSYSSDLRCCILQTSEIERTFCCPPSLIQIDTT
eukprot:1196071-Prorocentrum_minimum.AAC.3